MEAAKALVEITPQAVLNAKTTGSPPSDYTCLHFACEGSDKTFGRADLVRALVEKKADLEERTAKGNTVFLLASGTGVTDIQRVLLHYGADANARNSRQLSAVQSAIGSSGSAKRLLQNRGHKRPKKWVPSGKQRTGVGPSRRLRRMHRAANEEHQDSK